MAVRRWTKLLLMSGTGGTLLAGSCLYDNFWATLLGDTLITGTASYLLDQFLTTTLP
jgi:hypothetical protein